MQYMQYIYNIYNKHNIHAHMFEKHFNFSPCALHIVLPAQSYFFIGTKTSLCEADLVLVLSKKFDIQYTIYTYMLVAVCPPRNKHII